MPALSPAAIYSLAIGAGLSPAAATTATAIALAESGGRPDAVGDVGLQDGTWGPSVGLWQVRSLKAQSGTGGPRDATRLADPVFNAQSMAQISGAGANFKPWTTYTQGTYKSHLAQVSSTVPAAAQFPDATAPAAAGSSAGQSVAAQMGTGGLFGTGLFDWAPTAFTVAIKVAGGVAAAALVIVGAVHTVN